MSNLRVIMFEHPQAVRLLVGLGVAGCLAVGVAVVRSRVPRCGGWFWKACQACPGLDEAIAKRDAGRYDDVATLTDAALQAHPELTCWQDFKTQFNSPLKVGFKLDFLPGRGGALRSAPGGPLRLSTSDPYYVLVNPSVKAYVYLFQTDPAGNLTAIFPNPETTALKNPLPPGEQRIPGGDHNLTVSPQAGMEHLYLVAANWEIPELQQIAQQASSAKGGSRKSLAQRFLARAKDEKHFGHWDVESLGAARPDGDTKE